MKDYYMVFGLEASCEQEMIRKKYRELAKRYHPDLAKNEEENKDLTHFMAALNEAYEILSNPTSRANYDHLYAKSFRKDHEDYSIYQSCCLMDMISVTLDAWKSMMAYILDEDDTNSREDYEYDSGSNDSHSDIYELRN